MSDKSLSSLARMLGVLDLFNETTPVWTAEAVAEAMKVSVPTAYRYVKLLVASGLLQRSAESQYSLGPRIIVLDHFIRTGDPVLQHAIPFMQELVATTGFDCVISALYGQQLLDTHREYGSVPADLGYGRGRPRPLFLGGAPKVILSCLPPNALHKVFDQYPQEIAQAGLPTEWSAFRKYYSSIRKAGHYLSNGELESNLAALAAPIQQADGTVLGAISLVTTVQRMAVIDVTKVAALVMRCAADIAIRVP
jgi:DNA-binding IclR family transcriptional regulator